eukprot:1159831-Pelagomonas_calceolata.AAC.13
MGLWSTPIDPLQPMVPLLNLTCFSSAGSITQYPAQLEAVTLCVQCQSFTAYNLIVLAALESCSFNSRRAALQACSL